MFHGHAIIFYVIKSTRCVYMRTVSFLWGRYVPKNAAIKYLASSLCKFYSLVTKYIWHTKFCLDFIQHIGNSYDIFHSNTV